MTYTVLHLTGFDIYISQFGEISIKRTETKNSIKEDIERISGLIAMVKQKQYDDFGHRELKPSKNSKRYDLQERQTIAAEKNTDLLEILCRLLASSTISTPTLKIKLAEYLESNE